MSTTLVIAGTDTEIGKTVFSAALTSATGGTYWKPIQSGLEESTDTETAAQLGVKFQIPEVYRLKTPCSPHRAAEIDGVSIDVSKLSPPTDLKSEPLIIETAGGLMVPLTDHTLQIDVLARWQKPVILCARTSLGTINHTLLSLEALHERRIPVIGVAFIGDSDEAAEKAIISFGKVPRLGRLPICNPISAETLKQTFTDNFNTQELLKAAADAGATE